MKKWFIECPFCKNEIKEGAIKCQHCWEFLEKKHEKKKKKIWTLWWIGIIILVLAFFWAIWKNSSTNTTTTRKTNSSTMIIEQTNKNWEIEKVEVPKEYLNALKKAQSYSDHQYMSEKSLYKQLTSKYWEWFTEDAANYAISNVKADYNYNALMKWKSYYEHQNMSKQNVYNQLRSEYWEWFTKEQAQYAIDHLDD